MAVVPPNLTITLSTNYGCSELNLIDATGDYNAVTNPLGYGLPSGPDTTDITGCEIVVTFNSLGSTATYDFTIAADVITAATLTIGSGTPANILSELPSTAWPFVAAAPFNLVGDYGVTLPTFADEVFKVEYNITGEIAGPESFDFTTTGYEPIICVSDCCVNRIFQSIDWNCGCSDEKVTKALYGETLLKQVVISCNAGDLTAALQALEQLRLLCAQDSDCGC